MPARILRDGDIKEKRADNDDEVADGEDAEPGTGHDGLLELWRHHRKEAQWRF